MSGGTTAHILEHRSMTACQPPFYIEPVLISHAEGASFCWGLLDQPRLAYGLLPARQAYLNNTLSAHLDGLLVAGPASLTPAMKALARWKQAGESFVATWLAAMHDEDAATNPLEEKVLPAVRQNPENLLRGVISALAYLPEAVFLRAVARLSQPGPDRVLEQVVALRAVAIAGRRTRTDSSSAYDPLTALSQPLSHFAQSEHVAVRASACRVLAVQAIRELGSSLPASRTIGPLTELIDQWEKAWFASESAVPVGHSTLDLLRQALSDTACEVGAEAAIGLAEAYRQVPNHPDAGNARRALQACILQQTAVYSEQTGAVRAQAARRLRRWVSVLAGVMPVGSADAMTQVNALPTDMALTFLLHHGDPTLLPQVVALMRRPGAAGYGGWVWQTMTGIDLEAHGYLEHGTTAEEKQSPEDDVPGAAGHGSVRARIDALDIHHYDVFPAGTRILLGQPLTTTWARSVLESEQSLAVRSVAAGVLAVPSAGRTARIGIVSSVRTANTA